MVIGHHDRLARNAGQQGRLVSAALVGALALFATYTAIVAGASGSFAHYTDRLRADWYFVVPLTAGFGTQVALLVELRRRKRLHALAAGIGVSGAGASTAGMIACCAHHIVDLAPFLGASAAATLLTTWKLPLILVGLAVNAAGIVVGVRNLRKRPTG
jgi:hypothetical protein